MLEGTVARILNQLLGKYVLDLDTENLNVGIFSGKVQLTDLKLKPEALYELNLPIEVKTGTIGKIWLQIPWNALWTQSITVNIEDIHMVANPIVRNEPFDMEKNKKLIRAFKRAILERLESAGGILGPSTFADHLVSNILSYIQLNITNIHVRYEDTCSWNSAIAGGLCIGSITAQTTNSKWRRCSYDPTSENVYYQVKLEAVSMYWNTNVNLKEWDLPSEYYQWRNSMVKSMENYCFDGENFKFVLNPMTIKFRITMNKNKSSQVRHVDTEIIVQDCNLQLTKTQYDSITAVLNNFKRMLISWQFLEKRPLEKIVENPKAWWRYAYWATLEQRVRPLTWSRIKKIREDYKIYVKTYKQIILNPNDTELKLDLQKNEDNLSIVNVVIARQHTRLLMRSSSLTEKGFWSLLPSPDKAALCEKIGYIENEQNEASFIGHSYNFKLGNFNLTLSEGNKEVLAATVTQTIITYKPNHDYSTYSASLKVEGLILEGNGPGNLLTSLLSSEHLKDSPAFFLKINIEKLADNQDFTYRLQVALDSLEFIYNKKAFEDLECFLHATVLSQRKNLLNYLKEVPNVFYEWATKKIENKWDLHLNIKCPFFVIPESSSCLVSENLLVIDMGRFTIKTEICQHTKLSDSFTQMEMEEKLYSKLYVDCREFQVLFCDKNDHWKDARREKDTNMHLVPKTGFSSVYALSVLDLPTIPSMKFNINFNSLKLNMSEKKSSLILKFFDIDQIRINVITDAMQPNLFVKDCVTEISGFNNFRNIQKKVSVCDTLKYKKYKIENGNDNAVITNGLLNTKEISNNMNEAWARTVDLPGLEDNISPKNTIQTLYGVVLNEFSIIFSKSSDSADRQYLMLRLGQFTMDVAFMTYGPAYQMSIHSILLTDKLHTTPSGQYLDMIFTPLPTSQDVVTVLYRKVKANCPDFWTHFHGVETSLVANFGAIHALLHQEAVHTLIKYSKYLSKKMKSQTSQALKNLLTQTFSTINDILHKPSDVPVPPGSVKFSQSARMSELIVNVCDSDFDIINVQISGLEMDFLFRANERFVFRSFLSSINVDHLSPLTLYSKVLYTDEDKVFEVKYVRNANHLSTNEMMMKENNQKLDGVFKFQLGRMHFIVLYKLMVQLKRFVVNLEALDYLEKAAQLVENAVKTATETLKNKTKISLDIDVCGPVFLIPQKSSSPNVIVIDTGNLKIENFFKEGEIQIVENILLKVNETVVTRGVMSLQSTLEMQEILIEPICLTMDIKKTTNLITAQKVWDIDGVLDKIEVTLGQKDLSLIMSIYADNIGEANIVDFLPEQMRSPSILSDIFEQDDCVKDLEAFFSDPKQKFLSAKCRIDEVKVLLFFDAGELLSSPIRDLNHGLCKLEINDIDSSVLIYTDESCDGKLSVEKICVEEIGPEANVYSKLVLGAPPEDGRNNNLCNITVNKPPLIDVTFHQNKNGDRSADIIVGRLCLSLSIPFCEKVALYVLECIPKDIQEAGIVNLGYEGDIFHPDKTKTVSNSLTISVRVNKPELMVLVETTSNRKRYFITKTEIMVDYSNHGTRTNLVTSFSGLHSLFYDLDEYSDHPYTILRQCDVEFGRNVDENWEKVTLEVSGVYVKICSEVVHSINDILNDVVEHFKLPDQEMDKLQRMTKQEKKRKEVENLWEPKKMETFISNKADLHMDENTDLKQPNHQILTIPKFEVVLIFDLEQIQTLLLRSTVEVTAHDWNHSLHCNGEVSFQANYFNETVQNWEPLVEPITLDEKFYRPWECQIKVFQDKSLPINDTHEEKPQNKSPGSSVSKTQKTYRSYTTTEDEDSGEDMMYLEPVNSCTFSGNRRVKTSLSTFLEDSDSETDEGAMEKLAAAITDLFTGDWNEQEDSEVDNSSDEDNDLTALGAKPREKADTPYGKCLYVLLNSKDALNITVTPSFLKIFNELMAQYTSKIVSVKQNRQDIHVTNDIGPNTRVEFYEKVSENKQDVLVTLKKFEKEDSLPNSPTRNIIFTESSFEEDHISGEKLEQAYDFSTVRSLTFPPESTSELYDKMNKNYVKIFVPNFTPIQTNCSKRDWEKLVKLPSKDSLEQNYFLALKHSVGRTGRQIVVGSPLQIKNETCFALNIMYQPSILQQLNLEPIGEVTNPFETTMRIAILEPQEEYNVPLYVAYHCTIFVQPAYAEGHYASETGIWWKKMALDLDSTHNLICRPKNPLNTEPFALKVALRRNIETRLSSVHSVPNYRILLLPPLTVHNFLPYTLVVESPEAKHTIKTEPGEKCSIYTLDLTKDQKLSIKITYNSTIWTGHLTLTGHLDEKVILMSSNQQDESKNLNVNVKCDKNGGCNLIFYAPYWIVNKTGLPVTVKANSSHSIYTCPNNDILLFTYKRHCKQTLNVKVYDSNWSNEFGMECSGTTGLVVCKDSERKKKYLFFLNTKLSNFSPRLTKIVTILPSFLVTNNTDKSLRYMEYNEKTDLWIDLEPQKTQIFWPETSSVQIHVKYKESKSISQPFFITLHHKTVLRMEKGTALSVEVKGGTDGPFEITFFDYQPGDAPVLIKNYCADLFLKIQQQDQSPVTLMSPNHSMYYTWDDPIRPRQLVWNVYNNKGGGFLLDITKDGYGEEKIKFHSVTPTNASEPQSSSSEDSDSSSRTQTNLNKKVRKDKIVIYWACLVEGAQRVLIFTQDQRMFENLLNTKFHEPTKLEVISSLSEVGLSLFTSDKERKEHIYASINDLPPIWEVNVGQRWKTLTLELASWIEDKYKRFGAYKKCQIKDYVHIDFEKMFMIKPFFAEMRRTYSPGMFCHFRKSCSFHHINFQIQNIQIDNFYSNSVVFQPSTMTNNLTNQYEKQQKPCLKICVSKQVDTNFETYRYVDIRLSDMVANVENDLWSKIGEIMKLNKKFGDDRSVSTAYITDITNIRKSITNIRHPSELHQQTSRIEHLNLSNFGIQLNIANRAQMSLFHSSVAINRVLNHLFPYNMAPYMPIEGVHHKISSTEWVDLNDSLYHVIRNLLEQVSCQFLQQYYSQVLGLQVLVNTFAIQPGIELNHYDTHKNSETTSYSCRCILGHINMSTAALETSIQDVFPHINLDQLLQLKSRKYPQESGGILPKMVGFSSKSFYVGVPGALAQLFVKNHNVNVQCDGELFFKTTGKALFSLITRHPDEKTDCVSLAKEALRRAAILGEPIRIHQRIARYRNSILGLSPFSMHESIGQHILETIANCRYSNDTYWAHTVLDKNSKTLILVSLEHVFRINKFSLWGAWELEWFVELDNIISLPKINCVELILNLRPNESTSLKEYQVKIGGPREVLVWLHEKIEQAIILSMEDKSWPLED